MNRVSTQIVASFVCVLSIVALLAILGCDKDRTSGGDRRGWPSLSDKKLPELEDGPLTPAARVQVALLADSTGKNVFEAYRALLRIGWDAVPALVEVLDGSYNNNVKQNALGILGELGVAADRAMPHLEHLKVTGSTWLSNSATLAIRKIEQANACGLTGLPDEVEVHVVGCYRGKKELDIQLGKSGHTVTEIEVVVDRTEKPVVLVLTAYDPVVWRVGTTGASKLAAVLVSGYHTQALLGIPRALAHKVISGEQSMDCGAFHAEEPSEAVTIEREVVALTGHGIDRFHGASPSGRFRIGGNPSIEPTYVSYSSDLTIDDYPVYRGEVPAGPRGVDELHRRGKIRLATQEDIDAWLEGARRKQPDLGVHLYPGGAYVVVERITLPPGLYGAHSRDFIIPAHVPKPDGPKGHCKFYYMKDFTME